MEDNSQKPTSERKFKYKIRTKLDEYEQITRLAELGLTNNQIAYYLGITPQALYFRIQQDAKLFECIKIGKARGIEKVAQTAFNMATSGLEPSMTMFWLKTQARWREQDPISVNLILGKFGVKDISELSVEQIDSALAEIIKPDDKRNLRIEETSGSDRGVTSGEIS